jgi:hypothetical protein
MTITGVAGLNVIDVNGSKGLSPCVRGYKM